MEQKLTFSALNKGASLFCRDNEKCYQIKIARKFYGPAVVAIYFKWCGKCGHITLPRLAMNKTFTKAMSRKVNDIVVYANKSDVPTDMPIINLF